MVTYPTPQLTPKPSISQKKFFSKQSFHEKLNIFRNGKSLYQKKIDKGNASES